MWVAAVRYARSTGLPAAVRSGGHSFPRSVAMRRWNRHRPRVDEGHSRRSPGKDGQGSSRSGTRRARPRNPGLRHGGPGWNRHDHGVAGLTLGGGIGWLMRKYGLTIDQLLSVDLVTADGEFVKASETRTPISSGACGRGRQLWHRDQLRVPPEPGGADRAGRSHHVADRDAAEVLRFYRDWIEDVPDELTTIIVNRKAPASAGYSPGVSRQARNHHHVLLCGLY